MDYRNHNMNFDQENENDLNIYERRTSHQRSTVRDDKIFTFDIHSEDDKNPIQELLLPHQLV